MRPHLWQASALALLFAVCVLAAPVVLTEFGALWGLLAAAGAFLLWYLAGPPPLPGLVPGILGMVVLFGNAVFAIVAVLRWMTRG